LNFEIGSISLTAKELDVSEKKTRADSLMDFTPFILETGDLDITLIPTWLAERLGISVFAAGLLSSMIVLLMPLVLIIIFTRGKGFVIELIVSILALSIDVAIGWLPVWLFGIIILMIAFGFARFMTDKIGGSGKD
jgi:hypothetical protein